MRSLRLLAVACALLFPTVLQATPLTFVLDHGSVTARLQMNGSTLANAVATLDAGFVVLDPATGEIRDFSLASSDVFFIATLLPGDYNALDLDIQLTPGAGYASSATGSNPWSVTLGPIDVAYAGTALDVRTPVTVSPVPVSGALTVNAFRVTAELTPGLMRLGLYGVKVGEIRWGDDVFDVRADIELTGYAVPEPSLAGLAAIGLAGLAWLRRR